jgi:hypothetical protein
MNIAKRLAGLSLLLVLAACSGIRVATDHDPKTDFVKLRTYAWVQRPKPADPMVVNTLVVNRVRESVDRALQAKGFRQAPPGSPDVLVNFAFASRGRTEIVAMPGWGPWRRWGNNDIHVVDYVEGALAVSLYDPKTEELLWMGAASRPLDDDSGSAEKVDEVVNALFAAYPPRR